LLEFLQQMAYQLIITFHRLNPPCSVGTSSAANP
jgi:hypothetical protein